MSLDFTNFEQISSLYIPDYLNNPINAIRPELTSFAYHYSYNYFFDAAGNTRDKEALFNVFRSPRYYMSQWSTGGLERRYAKPQFEIIADQLHITARMDFRWEDKRPIVVKDLPIIPFEWALNLLKGEFVGPATAVAPATVVVLGYAQEELVNQDGLEMHKGTRYMIGGKLGFGAILKEQILTAG
ncbi:hypothetical protein [Pseudomonas sp. BGI-2]|uniref:hypothetical protein n=1 Tax=Pseudomonas sp. BGI-2 TaxID=2528211 RepID=UPI002113CCDB|nr:hypothetical protein [Pseudomonas sp. BGI-2]